MIGLIVCIVIIALLIIVGIYFIIDDEISMGIGSIVLALAIVCIIVINIHRCPECNKLYLGDKYCEDCGTYIEKYSIFGSSEKVYCKGCGAEVKPEQKYCTRCGANLQNDD